VNEKEEVWTPPEQRLLPHEAEPNSSSHQMQVVRAQVSPLAEVSVIIAVKDTVSACDFIHQWSTTTGESSREVVRLSKIDTGKRKGDKDTRYGYYKFSCPLVLEADTLTSTTVTVIKLNLDTAIAADDVPKRSIDVKVSW